MEARSHFMDAVSLEADCAEAIYNLGLVSKAVGNLEDALTAFKRMNSTLADDTSAMFQVCHCSICWNRLGLAKVCSSTCTHCVE